MDPAGSGWPTDSEGAGWSGAELLWRWEDERRMEEGADLGARAVSGSVTRSAGLGRRVSWAPGKGKEVRGLGCWLLVWAVERGRTRAGLGSCGLLGGFLFVFLLVF